MPSQIQIAALCVGLGNALNVFKSGLEMVYTQHTLTPLVRFCFFHFFVLLSCVGKTLGAVVLSKMRKSATYTRPHHIATLHGPYHIALLCHFTVLKSPQSA